MTNLSPELIAINERIKAFNAKRQQKTNKPKIEVKVEFESNARGVKQFLKLSGYNPKDFSVRKNNGGYETTLYVEIKDLSISCREIKKIISGQFENIYYDDFSHEILAGGNTFVNVQYSDSLSEELISSKAQEADDLLCELNKLADWESLHIERNGCDLYLTNNKEGFQSFSIREIDGDFHRYGYVYEPKDIARALAEIEAH